MEPIADLAALKPIVDALLERGLMLELTPPGRGQIVSHALYLPHELAELKARHAGHAPRPDAFHGGEENPQPSHTPPPPARTTTEAPARDTARDEIAALSAELTELRAEVASLREQVGALEARIAAAQGR
jgi:hypothetical protein